MAARHGTINRVASYSSTGSNALSVLCACGLCVTHVVQARVRSATPGCWHLIVQCHAWLLGCEMFAVARAGRGKASCLARAAASCYSSSQKVVVPQSNVKICRKTYFAKTKQPLLHVHSHCYNARMPCVLAHTARCSLELHSICSGCKH